MKPVQKLVLTLSILLAISEIGCRRHAEHFVLGNTSCMSPTLNEGERVTVRVLDSKQGGVPRRYDIVAFNSPVEPGARWVMRIIGLPGEQVSLTTNSITVNGTAISSLSDMPAPLREGPWLTQKLLESNARLTWHLAKDEVFVVGDNLAKANDGRYWGPLKLSAIIGVVESRL